jgi:hypothetical protein
VADPAPQEPQQPTTTIPLSRVSITWPRLSAWGSTEDDKPRTITGEELAYVLNRTSHFMAPSTETSKRVDIEYLAYRLEGLSGILSALASSGDPIDAPVLSLLSSVVRDLMADARAYESVDQVLERGVVTIGAAAAEAR